MLLAQLAFELERQSCLFGLTYKGAVLVEEDHPSQLLRDGARPLFHLAAGDIGDQGPANADDVNTVVLIEAGVFRSNEGFFNQLGHLSQSDLLPGSWSELLQHIPISREDCHRARPAEGADAAGIRQQAIKLLQHRRAAKGGGGACTGSHQASQDQTPSPPVHPLTAPGFGGLHRGVALLGRDGQKEFPFDC